MHVVYLMAQALAVGIALGLWGFLILMMISYLESRKR